MKKFYVLISMDKTTLLCVLIALIVVGCFLFVKHEDKNENYLDLVKEPLPTSSEIELIQGEPDYHLIDPVDDSEVVRVGDIAMSPGFGMGEGTVGFGRYGSSFII